MTINATTEPRSRVGATGGLDAAFLRDGAAVGEWENRR